MTKESGFVIINHVVKTTQKFIAFEPLAQAAEHLPFKQGVPGSIPGWLTNIVIYTFKDTAIGVLKAVNNISHSRAAALLHCEIYNLNRRFVTFDFDASITNYSTTATCGIRPFFAR